MTTVKQRDIQCRAYYKLRGTSHSAFRRREPRLLKLAACTCRAPEKLLSLADRAVDLLRLATREPAWPPPRDMISEFRVSTTVCRTNGPDLVQRRRRFAVALTRACSRFTRYDFSSSAKARTRTAATTGPSPGHGKCRVTQRAAHPVADGARAWRRPFRRCVGSRACKSARQVVLLLCSISRDMRRLPSCAARSLDWIPGVTTAPRVASPRCTNRPRCG